MSEKLTGATGKIYVHIGLPKTATTTLQANLFPLLNVIYAGTHQPRDGNKKSSLYGLFYSAIIDGSGLQGARQVLRNYAFKGQSILFSDEMILVGKDWSGNLGRLRCLLEGFDFEIIVTVREPVAAIFSYYCELYPVFSGIKSGVVGAAKCAEEMKIYCYDILIGELLMNFPSDRMHYFKFEDIVNGNLASMVALIDGERGFNLNMILGHENKRKKINSQVITGHVFSCGDVLRKTLNIPGGAVVYNALRKLSRLKKVMRQLDEVRLWRKKIPVPSNEELAQLKVLTRAGLFALEKESGIDYSR